MWNNSTGDCDDVTWTSEGFSTAAINGAVAGASGNQATDPGFNALSATVPFEFFNSSYGFTTDITGKTRPATGGWSPGAYEAN